MKKKLSLILAIIMVAAVVCTAIPFAVSAESDSDVVAKISVNGGAETNITRGEFKDKFADNADTNLTKTGAFSGEGKNVLIKILMDIDVGENQLGFYPGNGSTITVDGDPNNTGTNAKLIGSNTANPTIRVRSSGSGITDDTIGGTIIFQNFDYNKTANNFMQYYGYPKIEINDSHWTGVGSIQLSGTGGIINVNDGSVLESSGSLFADSWSGTTSKNVINVNTGATVKHSSNPSKNVVELTQAHPNHTFNVNGGTVIGGITLADGAINLNSGSHTGLITGNVTATVAPGFVLDDAGITTPPPYVPDGDGMPEITGDPNDIVIEIYVGDSTTNPIQIMRSEVTTKLANSRGTNILCANADLLDQDIRVEVLYDIDLGEKSINFYVNPGRTLTVNGNDHVIMGYEEGLPVMRANSVTANRAGGDVVFNELDIYNPRSSVFQYYTNGQVDINDCEWTSVQHCCIWGTDTGDASVLNINEGSVIEGGWVAVQYSGGGSNTGATININEGATVIGEGGKVVAIQPSGNPLPTEMAGVYLNVYGDITSTADNGTAIHVADAAIGTIIMVDGGNIKGTVSLADYVTITLASGSIEGDLAFDTEDDEYVDIAGSFIVNGEAWDPTDTGNDGGDAGNDGNDGATTGDNNATTGDNNATTGDGSSEGTEGANGTNGAAGTNGGSSVDAPDSGNSGEDGDDTTAAPDIAGGCAGCGGTEAAFILLALISAAAAVVVIKKK